MVIRKATLAPLPRNGAVRRGLSSVREIRKTYRGTVPNLSVTAAKRRSTM